MKEDIYLDGIQQIHFIGGMVRMDMFIFAPQPNADPMQKDIGRLVMTPQGFLSALDAMQQLASKLAEAGVIQKQPQ